MDVGVVRNRWVAAPNSNLQGLQGGLRSFEDEEGIRVKLGLGQGR
jgi:hypothetical protein